MEAQQEAKIKLPVVMGPTASGKTGLAVELAKRLNGEVVSADSMQIYAALSIGTARPTAEEMQGIPHHLTGFLPLSEGYSVARYVQDAAHEIAAVNTQGRWPILCGGTGLYIQSLIENIAFDEQAESNEALRTQLRARAAEEGGQALLDELAAVDPETAARLHPNDTGRIVRALEVYHTTGETLSEHARRSRRHPSPYDACLLLLDFHDRQVLYERINRRVDAMLAAGLVEEAREALATPYAPTAMQAIGYKELAPYLAGDVSLTEAVENLKRATRRYAKRQLSWFRRMESVQPLYVDEYPDTAALTAAAWNVIRTHYGV